MAYLNRKPPIKLSLSINDYNKLVTIVSNFEDDYYLNKLLQYSIITEEKTIEIGFYTREIPKLIIELMKQIDIKNKNYYTQLMKNRKN